MKATKNIAIVDDQSIVLQGLTDLIPKLGPYKISGQYYNGRELMASLDMKPAPDLIILDLQMPGMNGDEVMEKLKATGNKTPVLVLTVSDEEERIHKLFQLGARGYLVKNCKAEEMQDALNHIFLTGYYHNELFTHLFQTSLNTVKKSLPEEREKEFILFNFAEGKGKIKLKVSDILFIKSDAIDPRNKEVIVKGGSNYTVMNHSFKELTSFCSSLIQVNRSMAVSMEIVQKVESDLITLNTICSGIPKEVTLNRTFKKDFLKRLESR